MSVDPCEVEDLTKYNFYDINLEDDGVLTANLEGDGVVVGVLPMPADAEDPDEVIVVKKIVIWALDESGIWHMQTVTDASLPRQQSYFWMFSMFPFDETTENTEAYRDEFKESLAKVIMFEQAQISDTATEFTGAGGQMHNWPKAEVKFKKAQLFPLNIFFKLVNDVTNVAADSFALDISVWNLRIYYIKKKMRLGIFGRLMAVIRKTLSVAS